MIVAHVTSCGKGIATHSCPATELRGERGMLTLWPRSAAPIRIPFAWIYWLRFEEV
jgi:hypothetical protein